MNSEATTATATAASYELIPLSALRESRRNPRQSFNKEALDELTDSVRARGILTPLLVRPIAHKKDGAVSHYEIGAGHRRFRAARAAGLEHVPAVVREMDDDAFLELLGLENLQRADLDPLDEAAVYRDLMALRGRDVNSVAVQVSKSVAYVYDRVKLLDLIDDAKVVLLAGEITVSHGILLARLKPDEQQRALKQGLFEQERVTTASFIDSAPTRKPVSVREFEAWIDQTIRFDREAVDPVVHPETHAALFEAQQAEQAVKVVPITYLHQIPESARADERTLTVRSWKRADGKVDPTGSKKPSKECEFAVLGVVVVGPYRGDTFSICTAKQKCRAHWALEQKAKEAKVANDGAKKPGAEPPWKAEERRRERRLAAWALVEKDVAADLDKAVQGIESFAGNPKATKLLAELFSLKPVQGETADELLRNMVVQVVSSMIPRARWNGGEALRGIGNLLGVNVAAHRKRGERELAKKDAAAAEPAKAKGPKAPKAPKPSTKKAPAKKAPAKKRAASKARDTSAPPIVPPDPLP